MVWWDCETQTSNASILIAEVPIRPTDHHDAIAQSLQGDGHGRRQRLTDSKNPGLGCAWGVAARAETFAETGAGPRTPETSS